MSSLDNLKPFKKGQSGNPKGRPRKMVTKLKDIGYSMSEINDTIQNMLGMTIAELKEIAQNDHATILEKTIATGLGKSLNKGSLYVLETLLSRRYGRPVDTIDQTLTIPNANIEVKVLSSGVPLAKNENDITE